MTIEDLRKYLLAYLDNNMITHAKLAERLDISSRVLRKILAEEKDTYSELTKRKIIKFLKDNNVINK